jgi:hypothetical protein
MADEGVIGATVEETKRHPVLIVGGLLALLGVVWLVSRGSSGGSTTTPQNFSFSYGPSNAQLQTQTALAISQNNDQTAVSLANIAAASQQTMATTAATNQQALASTQAGVYSNYFNYLTTSGANNNSTALQAAQIASNTANYAVNANDAAATQIASIQGQSANLATTTAGAVQQASIAAQLQSALAGYKQAATQTAASVQVASLNNTAALQQTALLSGGGGSGSTISGTQGAVSNADFVSSLYHSVLGRNPDPTGLSGWINALNTGVDTRAQVAAGFTGSAEYQADLVAGKSP